jgi:uncharacterized membrane protein (UPF0127 family)
MNWRLLISLVGAGLLAGACGKGAPVAAPPAAPPTAGAGQLPTRALPRLRTMKLRLGAEQMTAELAVTPEQITTGMMFRTNIEEDTGMLFLLGRPVQPSFWMKNCPLPLSAAYIDPAGIILELHDFQPQDTHPVVATAHDVQYVLETSRGWFEQHHIRSGMSVRTEYGSFQETFVTKRDFVR